MRPGEAGQPGLAGGTTSADSAELPTVYGPRGMLRSAELIILAGL